MSSHDAEIPGRRALKPSLFVTSGSRGTVGTQVFIPAAATDRSCADLRYREDSRNRREFFNQLAIDALALLFRDGRFAEIDPHGENSFGRKTRVRRLQVAETA